jgi:beta-1,4-mannosyltransferase
MNFRPDINSRCEPRADDPSAQMSVVFAPDYRAGNPYQSLLAESLKNFGCRVSFLSDYRRGLPLTRGITPASPDIFHLHWPEYYFKAENPLRRRVRRLRFRTDLFLASHGRCLAVTAHNLIAHEDKGKLDPLIQFAFRRADVIFAHSDDSKLMLIDTLRIRAEKIHLIPCGDLSASLRPAPDRAAARLRLSLKANEKYALIFGRLAPYKGIEEIVKYWVNQGISITLVIAGSAEERFGQQLRELTNCGGDRIQLRLGHIPDAELADWLVGADCAIFNYPRLLTSGSAALARSFGLPVLFPTWLTTADLGEPSSRVFRFAAIDKEFETHLNDAVTLSADFDTAADWREATAWSIVAKKTFIGYAEALNRTFAGSPRKAQPLWMR